MQRLVSTAYVLGNPKDVAYLLADVYSCTVSPSLEAAEAFEIQSTKPSNPRHSRSQLPLKTSTAGKLSLRD